MPREDKPYGGWYEFEIICPNGQVMIAKVFGSGFSEGGAFVDAKGAAQLKAAAYDDTWHLPYGSHKVGRGRKVTEWM